MLRTDTRSPAAAGGSAAVDVFTMGHRELVAQGIGPGLDRPGTSPVRAGAGSFSPRFRRTGLLAGCRACASAAWRRVEDLSWPADAHSAPIARARPPAPLRQDALEHEPLLGECREQFGVAEQDGAAGQRLQHGRRTGQQRQPPLQHVGRPAHEAGVFLACRAGAGARGRILLGG